MWGAGSGGGLAPEQLGERLEAELLDQYGGHDDAALDHVLNLGGEVVDGEEVGDGGEDQHPEEGADDGAAAAAEQRATDDRRGDRVELVEIRHRRLGAGRL